MVGFFRNFRAKRSPNGWVTHGMMHACHVDLSRLQKWTIRGKKNERDKKGWKEYLTASSSEFQHSDSWSSSCLELKLATLQEVGNFSYSG